MADKAHRLQFTEDDLSDRDIRKAANKAEKAANKADRAGEELPTKKRVRIVRNGGKVEVAEEGLSEKLRMERKSKPDNENDDTAKKRRARVARKSEKSGTTEKRLSDKLRSERQSAKAVKSKFRVEVTEEPAEKPGAAGRAAVTPRPPLFPL